MRSGARWPISWRQAVQVGALMDGAEDEVLSYTNSPRAHWLQIHSRDDVFKPPAPSRCLRVSRPKAARKAWP
jgi:hypothetical protein